MREIRTLRVMWRELDTGLRNHLPVTAPVPDPYQGSAYNGHFESVCYHPLFLFNNHGDCLAAKLCPGNVHSADDWDELLLPEIERQQAECKQIAFRADAAFAKPESTKHWKSAG